MGGSLRGLKRKERFVSPCSATKGKAAVYFALVPSGVGEKMVGGPMVGKESKGGSPPHDFHISRWLSQTRLSCFCIWNCMPQN